MDCVGRMAEILLCILCLTLIPATDILQNNKSRERNYIEVRTEELYGRIKQEKRLPKAEYERFKTLLASCPDYDYELSVARRYVLPVNAEEAENHLPVKIWYREELEEEFCFAEEIILEDAFFNLSIYGKDGYVYPCGGEVW